MISAKAVVVIGLSSLLIGVVAMIFAFQNVGWARYVCYAAIPIGAVAVLCGGIAASIGRVKNDLQ